MRARRSGFTLIELLVVIAIIGILAAMLFPVFARARESARKARCLSGMKNIAMALNMYLVDYDMLPPREHRPEVLAHFDDRLANLNPPNPILAPKPMDGHCQYGLYNANPYLRWPVILDDYVKNRDVWRCPAAKVEGGATYIIPDPDWFTYWLQRDSVFQLGYPIGPCATAWPNGWGGDVTDSLMQGLAAQVGQGNVFWMSIRASAGWDAELSSSRVGDASRHVVVCDAGVPNDDFLSPGVMAYPEICCMECAVPGPNYCLSADWTNPGDGSAQWQACLRAHAPGDGSMRSPTARAAYSRHQGGVNLGFLDGHVKWWPSEAILAAYTRGDLEGPRPKGPHSGFDGCTFTIDNPGVPVLY